MRQHARSRSPVRGDTVVQSREIHPELEDVLELPLVRPLADEPTAARRRRAER
jgi:hypothetical protein